MIYLIGGAPRVGKTRLVKTVLAEHPMHAVSCDAIRSMLRETFPKEQLSADLFLSSEKHIQSGSLQHILKDQNDESIALWPYLSAFIRSYDQDGYDLLLEGVAIIPELINRLEVPHRVIIIGNVSDVHAGTVADLALSNPKDWLHHHSPSEVVTYTKFFAHMSAWLRDEAQTYHVDYHEMHDDAFEDDLMQACHRLLG
jgi:2-phosphoglycerate kinase